MSKCASKPKSAREAEADKQAIKADDERIKIAISTEVAHVLAKLGCVLYTKPTVMIDRSIGKAIVVLNGTVSLETAAGWERSDG